MRTLSLPLEEYQKDLQKAEIDGRKESMRRFFLIMKQAKADPKDAVLMIVEEFEDDQDSINKMLDILGLRKIAEEIWSGK